MSVNTTSVEQPLYILIVKEGVHTSTILRKNIFILDKNVLSLVLLYLLTKNPKDCLYTLD